MTLAVGALGFFVAVSVWWIYFQRFDEHLVDRLLNPTHEHWLTARQRGLVYTFSHYFTHMGIVAAGVGITVMLEASLTDHAAESGGVGVLCAGVALFLVGSILCHQATPHGIDGHVRAGRVVAAAALLAYPGLGIRLSPLVTLLLIVGILLALIVLDDWVPTLSASPPETDVEH